jgi:hypothetical protein
MMASLIREAAERIFGWEAQRTNPDPAVSLPSIVPEVKDDGALVVAAGGAYGTYIDLDGAIRTDSELITRYREMALTPEIDQAVQAICDEAIIVDEKTPIVRLELDEVPLSDPIKELIFKEFEGILRLLEFNEHAYDIFRRWYVDGRLYYQAIINNDAPEIGIQKLNYIDPRKLRKVREVKQEVAPNSSVVVGRTISEYFMYSDKGFNGSNANMMPNSSQNVAGALKITNDSIVYATSGLTDSNRSTVLGWLNKAIKPMNQLREMEDSTVIYRIARAPERRIFYVEVGDMPKQKAEQYVQAMMTKHKNRLVYDGATGEVRDDRKFMTMLEDYWFPRRNNTSGTQVESLKGGDTLLHMEDVDYFKQKLYNSLNVPISRLNPETPFPFDGATVISRDEVAFSKFIDRLRNRFNHLFLSILRKQLILKRIMGDEDWDQIRDKIKFEYARDNYFDELKEMSIQKARLDLLTLAMPYGGKFFSFSNLRKNILKQNEEDMKKNALEIMEEMQDPMYARLYFPDPEAEQPGP